MQWSGSAVVWTVIIVAMMTVLAMEGVVMWRSGSGCRDGMLCNSLCDAALFSLDSVADSSDRTADTTVSSDWPPENQPQRNCQSRTNIFKCC